MRKWAFAMERQINLMMPEAFTQKLQPAVTEEGKLENVFPLSAARLNGINVISVSPLVQGQVK